MSASTSDSTRTAASNGGVQQSIRLVARGASETQPAPLTAEARLRLVQMLQTTLDPEHLLGLFLAEIQTLVEVDGLQHHVDGVRLCSAGRTASGQHSVSYNLVDRLDNLGEVLLQRRRPFREEELATLETLLSMLVPALRNCLAHRHVQRQSLVDPVTGAGNRAALHQHLQHAVATARRFKEPLALLAVSLDGHGRLGEHLGQAGMDPLLRNLVQCLQQGLRGSDRMHRTSDGNLAVVLPRTDAVAAQQIGERLRILATTVRGPVPAGDASMRPMPGTPLTVCIGATDLGEGDTVDSLLQRGWDTVANATRHGRNQVLAST